MNELWNIGDWINSHHDNWYIILIVYLCTQLINCILSSLKSYFTVKGTRTTATLFNTASYTIGAIITYLVGNIVGNIVIVILITAVSNLVGVYTGLTIADKIRKDKLWRISATVKKEDFEALKADLHAEKVDFITYQTSWEKRSPLDIFSHTREESSKIYKIIEKYDVKYTISSNSHQLYGE